MGANIINIGLCFWASVLCFRFKKGSYPYYLGAIFVILGIHQAFSFLPINMMKGFLRWIPETLLLLIPVLLVKSVRTALGYTEKFSAKWLLIPAGLYVKIFSYMYAAGIVQQDNFYESTFFYTALGGAFAYNIGTAVYLETLVFQHYEIGTKDKLFYCLQGLIGGIVTCILMMGAEVFVILPNYVSLMVVGLVGAMTILAVTMEWFQSGVPAVSFPIQVKDERIHAVRIASATNQITPKKELAPELREEYVQRVKEALEYRELYLNAKLSLSEFAKVVGMNPHHLSYIINREWELNFNELLNVYRVNKAKQLLLCHTNEAATMFAIAIDSGFNSESSFYTVFKKITGLSPKKFKDSVKSTSEL